MPTTRRKNLPTPKHLNQCKQEKNNEKPFQKFLLSKGIKNVFQTSFSTEKEDFTETIQTYHTRRSTSLWTDLFPVLEGCICKIMRRRTLLNAVSCRYRLYFVRLHRKKNEKVDRFHFISGADVSHPVTIFRVKFRAENEGKRTNISDITSGKCFYEVPW